MILNTSSGVHHALLITFTQKQDEKYKCILFTVDYALGLAEM